MANADPRPFPARSQHSLFQQLLRRHTLNPIALPGNIIHTDSDTIAKCMTERAKNNVAIGRSVCVLANVCTNVNANDDDANDNAKPNYRDF